MGIFFLIGPRGSGKSLTLKLLCGKYACRGHDTDRLVVEAAGKSIADIVSGEGWGAFRAAEKAALDRAISLMEAGAPGIVATGGGIILDPANRARMRQAGVAVYLAAPVDVLVARLLRASERGARPPLSDMSPEEEIRSVLAQRDPLYRETARYLINAALPPETVARVIYGTVIRSRARSRGM